MSHLLAILLFAAVTQTVKDDRTPLRTGCEAGDEVLGYLKAGAPITIRYAINGCVAVTSDELHGFLPPSAIVNVEEFDRARREAPSTTGSGNQQVNSKDPLALAIAGRDAYYADNLQQSIGLLKDSLEIKDDENVRMLLARVEREAATGLSKGRLVSTRFTMRYDDTMQVDQARAMLALLEEEFTRISAEIGCHPAERMIVILQNRQDYLRTSGMSEWLLENTPSQTVLAH